jgi:hypothetical protein
VFVRSPQARQWLRATEVGLMKLLSRCAGSTRAAPATTRRWRCGPDRESSGGRPVHRQRWSDRRPSPRTRQLHARYEQPHHHRRAWRARPPHERARR